MSLLTLDSSGLATDPPLVVDRIMNNFFVANYTQTVVHWGQIHSLPYLISFYAEDMTGLRSAVEESLSTMLQGHFEIVEVDVEIRDISNKDPRQNIIVKAVVYKDGQSYDVGRLLTLVKNKLTKIEEV